MELFRKKPIWLVILIAVIAGPVFNAGFNLLIAPLKLPLFLDSIATAVVAAVFGPVAGIITGLSTNWVIEIFNGFPMTNYPFGICGAATGLIVGLFAKKGKFSTIYTFFVITILVTLSNALIGAIIASFVFGGITDTNLAYLITGIVAAGRSIYSAAFLARLPVNLIDKGIAVAAAFVVYNRFLLQRPVFSSSISDDEDEPPFTMYDS